MEVQGQDLKVFPYRGSSHQLDLGAFPLAASPQVLPVHHQDLKVFPYRGSSPKVGFGEDLAKGRLELLRIQAVTASPSGEHLEEKGDGGVAWGLAQAQVGQEVGVGAGKAFHAAQGVHAAQEGHQDEGQKAPKGVLPVVGPRVRDLG